MHTYIYIYIYKLIIQLKKVQFGPIQLNRKWEIYLGQFVVVDQIRTVAMDQGTEGKAILKTAINQSIHQSIQLISGFNGSIGPNHTKKINQSINQ